MGVTSSVDDITVGKSGSEYQNRLMSYIVPERTQLMVYFDSSRHSLWKSLIFVAFSKWTFVKSKGNCVKKKLCKTCGLISNSMSKGFGFLEVRVRNYSHIVTKLFPTPLLLNILNYLIRDNGNNIIF